LHRETRMAQTPYIPSKQAQLVTFAENFASVIAANPSTYGLQPADAATISSYVTNFTTAYAQSSKQSPSTRTPAAITQTNNAQAAMLQVVRTYAQQIRNNQGVTSEAKQAAGITVPSQSKTPIPVPATAPAIQITGSTPLTFTMTIANPQSPASARAKAVGARSYAIFYSLAAGTTSPPGPPPIPSTPSTNVLAIGTKTPFPVSFPAGSSGMWATLWAAWTGRTVGTPGGAGFSPVSTPIQQIVQ
jgi:hypothetical protein